MKYEVSSLRTKRMLADALKEAMQKKSLTKVTVSEIVSACGVNRKTFYYHFEDIYDLLKWMLDQEAIEVVRQMDLVVNYEDAILFIMDYIDQNERLLKNLCQSVGRAELKRFFFSDFIEITRVIIDRAQEMEYLSVSADFKDFLGQFLAEAIAGILLDWIENKSRRNRARMIEYISLTLHASIVGILREAAAGHSLT